MPESEGSNLDTNTGVTGQGGMVDRTGGGVSGKGISQEEYDRNYAVGRGMEAAKDQGKSYS